MFPLAVPDYGDDPGTRRLGDILVKGKQYMATQEGFEWHGSGDTYVEHYLYHLLGDPTMQMWAAPPVRFDPSRFRGVIKSIREYRVPQPGDPPFFVQFQFPGEQLAIGSQITVFNGDEAIGRGIVGADGIANVIPDKPFNEQDNLTLSLQQDGAFPEQEAVEKRQPTQLSFSQPSGVGQSNNPNTFSGQIAPAFAGAPIRVVYTPGDPQDPNGTIEHTVTTGQRGVWTDQVNFTYYNGNEIWTAQAFFDGDDAHASSESNKVQFTVGD
jgi:hypothetical protein